MISRPFRIAVITLVVAAATLAAEEARKCSASAHECEQAIRQMLSGRRYLGAQLEERNPGLIIKAILPDGPAERAALEVGDRLMAVNGRSTKEATIRDFKEILSDARGTGRLFVIVMRHGRLMKVDVRLEPFSKAQIDKIVAQHLAQAHTSTATAPQPQP
jgi:predicted metalloprotease with PDZ domain